MTQRRWTTEDGYAVLTGWDRPLQYFFLDISRICPACEGNGTSGEDRKFGCDDCEGRGEQHVFSNLWSPKYPRGAMTLEDVMSELAEHLTAWPDTIKLVLAGDKATNAGNEVSAYEPIGRLKSPLAANA